MAASSSTAALTAAAVAGLIFGRERTQSLTCGVARIVQFPIELLTLGYGAMVAARPWVCFSPGLILAMHNVPRWHGRVQADALSAGLPMATSEGPARRAALAGGGWGAHAGISASNGLVGAGVLPALGGAPCVAVLSTPACRWWPSARPGVSDEGPCSQGSRHRCCSGRWRMAGAERRAVSADHAG